MGDPLRNNTGKIIRLYYNNCNGIEINLLVKSQINNKIRKNDSYLGEEQSSSKFDAIAEIIKDWEVNICCLAGTDTAWEHRSTKDAVKRVLKRRIDRCSTLISSSSSAKSVSNVKPGGTGMIMDGKWASRIIEKGEDPENMGRWSYVILGGRSDKGVMLVTAYRVCLQQIQDIDNAIDVIHRSESTTSPNISKPKVERSQLLLLVRHTVDSNRTEC